MNFSEWLLGEMEQRDISQSDLARLARISQSAISHILSGRRNPGSDFCQAIAHALRLPPETVYRAAGLLPRPIDYDPALEELEHLFGQMTESEKEEFLASGRLKIELRLARQRALNPKTQPRTG